MATNNYSDIETPNFSFFGGETILEQLRANLIRDAEDPTQSKFLIANAGTDQTVTTRIIYSDEADDNTNTDNNEKRVATRKWCKNAFISNVIDPHILATDYEFTSSSHIYDTADQLRCKTNGTLLNSVTRKEYVDNLVATKAPLANPTFTGTVSGISKAMVGLGNVDNTSDANKPISTATQTALDLKAPLANPTFTGTVGGISKAMVGLSNVDNTSDANKPISTATQSALDLKASLVYVDGQINSLVNGAPTLLNTLNEIAAALGDDPNFAASLTTALSQKQNIIQDGDLTIAKTANLSSTLNTLQTDVSSLQTSLTGKQDTIVDNSLAISHVANLQSSLTSLASDITSNTNTLNSVSSSVSTNTTAIASLETNKQDTIGANDLLISYVDGLQTALDAKQNTIGANDLQISYVSGLQTALDAKQDTIGANDLQISYVTGLQTALDAKQDTIGANDLQISYVSGLQTALDAKQNTIGTNDLQISYVSGLQTALNNADSSISAAVADITTLENTVANVQTTVSAHSTSIATLETTVAGLSTPSAPTNMVTTDTTQTISADKTFSGSITFNNAIAIPDASVAQSKVNGLATSLAAKQDTLNSSSAITVASINGVSSTTLGYLDATSSIQTQLNGKQATLTTGSVSDSLLSSVFVKPSTAPTLTGTNFSDIPQSAVTNLSTDLAGKQASIGSTTDLSFRNLTATGTVSLPSSSIPTSAIIPGGNLSVGALTCTSEVDSGNLKANSFCETLAAVTTNSSNNYTMNYNSGSVQYLATAPTANFTLALHNCLASGTQTSVYSLVYVNSGKFYPSTVNVYSDAGTTSVPCTVIWLGGTPTISSATVSIVTISIIKTALAATTYAMASLANYY